MPRIQRPRHMQRIAAPSVRPNPQRKQRIVPRARPRLALVPIERKYVQIVLAPEDRKNPILLLARRKARNRPKHIVFRIVGSQSIRRIERTHGLMFRTELHQRPQHRQRRIAIIYQRPGIKTIRRRAFPIFILAEKERRTLHGLRGASNQPRQRKHRQRQHPSFHLISLCNVSQDPPLRLILHQHSSLKSIPAPSAVPREYQAHPV